MQHGMKTLLAPSDQGLQDGVSYAVYQKWPMLTGGDSNNPHHNPACFSRPSVKQWTPSVFCSVCCFLAWPGQNYSPSEEYFRESAGSWGNNKKERYEDSIVHFGSLHCMFTRIQPNRTIIRRWDLQYIWDKHVWFYGMCHMGPFQHAKLNLGHSPQVLPCATLPSGELLSPGASLLPSLLAHLAPRGPSKVFSSMLESLNTS